MGPLGTNFSESLNKILTFPFKEICFKMSFAKCRPFCPGGNELTWHRPLHLVGMIHHNCAAAIYFIIHAILETRTIKNGWWEQSAKRHWWELLIFAIKWSYARKYGNYQNDLGVKFSRRSRSRLIDQFFNPKQVYHDINSSDISGAFSYIVFKLQLECEHYHDYIITRK